MITILGGTFAFLHPGHKALLKAAADTGNTVMVGLTTDAYLESNKRYGKVPFEERKRKVSEYLESLNADFRIVPLGTRAGSSETGADYTCIVVSSETYPRALRINRTRISNGLEPMRIIRVPYVLASDLFPISSTRIIEGEIDENGARLKPVRITVATGNNLKVKGVETVMGAIMGNITVDQDTEFEGETNQPMGEQTIELANERALFSLRDYDYSVGVESGLFRNRLNDTYFDIHCAVIVDRNGDITTGFSSGFQIPASLVEGVKRGLDLTEAVEKVYGKASIGSGVGLVGLLSDGRVNRADLIAEAVRNALIPRMTSRS